MRLRTPHEYWFRLHQLGANAWMWARQRPRTPQPLRFLDRYREITLRLLPPVDPAELSQLAEQILEHRFPIFAETIATGPEIDWRRDYIHQKTSGLDHFRFIPYLDAARVGDHKLIWELNRHQHLVVLARAHRMAPDPRFLNEIQDQLASWRLQNPFLRGINWASTLEVAFRALSWLAVLALVGDEFAPAERDQLWQALHQHGRYIANNLSVYFAPNTHLLGEALALAALGRVLGIADWSKRGDTILMQQRSAQVLPDGGYFEQSTYYHVYALDMFVMHLVLRGDEQPDGCVLDMAHWLSCVLGRDGKLALLGDDDGGNLFWPYGARERFGKAALERAESVAHRRFPTSASVLFASSGVATFSSGNIFVLIDCGPFGAGGAGHSHSDALSFIVREGADEILIDPGTFTYTADLAARDEFRGSARHSTVRVNGRNQAQAVNPFRWEQKPSVDVLEWRTNELLVARMQASSFTHVREFYFDGDVRIVDTIEAGPGRHAVEQFWQTAQRPQLLSVGCFAIGTAVLTLDPRVTAEVQEVQPLRLLWRTKPGLPHPRIRR